MGTSMNRLPSRPVAFAAVLCLLMLGGDLLSGTTRNPMALVFYCFLPVALWMIVDEQKRSTRTIASLEARMARLEESRRTPVLHEAG